jgi:iron complex transport system ATP-binding protein
VDRWDRRAFARQVAFLPQQARILFPFTVWEVVAMGRAPHQAGTYFESAADRARIAAALELAGCSHLSARPFQELSGGEQQLVCLAAALAQDPKVLLLDEPTVFLDLNHQLQVFEVLNQLHRKDGLTLVVVTHDLNLARFCCDRLVLLRSGQLRAEVRDPARGIPAELLSDVFEVPAARLEPFPGVIPERRSAP